MYLTIGKRCRCESAVYDNGAIFYLILGGVEWAPANDPEYRVTLGLAGIPFALNIDGAMQNLEEILAGILRMLGEGR